MRWRRQVLLSIRFRKFRYEGAKSAGCDCGNGSCRLSAVIFLRGTAMRPFCWREAGMWRPKEDVERFWKGEGLNAASNVQFGEGGAGTFSDGKLNTLVKDKEQRSRTGNFCEIRSKPLYCL